jgi:hypothetical protein
MSKIERATTDVKHQNLTLRMPADWIAALDGWRDKQPVPPKRSEVIRLAVLQFIARNERK